MSDLVLSDLTSTGDISQMETAKEVGDTLARKYPAYLWAVAWQGDAIVVKVIGLPRACDDWAFVIKPQNHFSASDLAHQAMIAGGELLERAGLRRA